MQTIDVLRQTVNIEALHEDLTSLAGDDFIGLSTRPGWVTAHMSETSNRTVIEAVRSEMLNHDATQLSPSQQAEQTRQSSLQTLRQQNETVLDEQDFAAQLPIIRQLAAKVAWLEQELRDLRGL